MSPVSGGATEQCVGCGARVPRVDGPVSEHRYLIAAPGCWAMNGELLARLLTDRDAAAVRQLCVDAYAVQHPGAPNAQAIQSVAGHLLSLYVRLELGLPARAASTILERVTRSKGQFHWLEPPSFEGRRTVGHVLTNMAEMASAAREWSEDAWQAWAPHHAQVRSWYDRLTGAHPGR